MRLLGTAVLVAAIAFGQESPVSYLPFRMPSRAANRILEQATWGPNPASTSLLQTLGFEFWYAGEVAAPVSCFADQPPLDALGKPNNNLAPVQVQFFQNALTGTDQVRQRVAFALGKRGGVAGSELKNA